jgi:signal transduction histidine kinase
MAVKVRRRGGSKVGPAAEGTPAPRPKARSRSLARPRRPTAASRDEFLSLAAHELRTPLTALWLHLDSVLRSGRRPGEPEVPLPIRGRVEAARRQVSRLAFLVDELLDMSRLCTGRLALVAEPVDLAEVARQVAARRAREAAAAAIPLTVRAEAPVHGRWDRGRLELVVTHLLDNALEWGCGRPVTIEVEQRGEEARLSVVDQGCGIAPSEQARIFRRYQRGGTGPEQGGLGLGLWITRELVERMGGAIGVESRPGAGARFHVQLPLARTG